MKNLAGIVVVLAAAVVVGGSPAAPTAKPPRIVSAVMLDADRDARADGVRLTYSTRVRHARDADGRYPFTVSGYQNAAVGRAEGKVIVIALVERADPDTDSRPAVRYVRTRKQPVTDGTRRQAAAQLFKRTQAHGVSVQPPPPPPPTVNDRDGDGTPDALDCAAGDAAIHPGAPDPPDLAFVDSNCDGIDGTEADAIFVSAEGNDANAGTKGKPKREIAPAILAASLSRKHVYVAGGAYARFDAKTGVAVYGGYDAADWSRRSRARETVVAGSPEAVLVDDERGIVLQLLTLRGANAGDSAYGIRAISGSAVRLEAVKVVAGDGAAGRAGVDGARGIAGTLGGAGLPGHCDSNQTVSSRWGGSGGAGAPSSVGRAGGTGGRGGDVNDFGADGGASGKAGEVGTPGGKGGSAGNPGKPGENGQPGDSGSNGSKGAGGTSTTAAASARWIGVDGRFGTGGTPGNGGGGGGGGGAQTGFFVLDGPGNGGGGGGSGGGGGAGGGGGRAGGGSFAVYLHNSTLVAVSSTLTAGSGGAGGRGGDGGAGGAPGGGGPGAGTCTSEVGRGGNGGRGGRGGDGGGGGGGAGGPSIAVMKVGNSSARLDATSVAIGAGGAPGASGFGGLAQAPAQIGIAQAVYP